jgi:hypothetical protein
LNELISLTGAPEGVTDAAPQHRIHATHQRQLVQAGDGPLPEMGADRPGDE